MLLENKFYFELFDSTWNNKCDNFVHFSVVRVLFSDADYKIQTFTVREMWMSMMIIHAKFKSLRPWSHPINQMAFQKQFPSSSWLEHHKINLKCIKQRKQYRYLQHQEKDHIYHETPYNQISLEAVNSILFGGNPRNGNSKRALPGMVWKNRWNGGTFRHL